MAKKSSKGKRRSIKKALGSGTSGQGAKGGKPGPGWFSRQQMRELFGVSEQVFDRRYRPMLPADAEQRDNRQRIWIHGRSLLDAWLQHELARQSAPPEDDGESLFSSEESTSPADERYKLARAKLAEMEFAERAREVVPRQDVRTAFDSIASILRQLGESFQREQTMTGREAFDQLDEALTECDDAIEQAFAEHDGDDDSSNSA